MEDIEELRRIAELYDELSQVIVGDKMQPPLMPLLALKRDALRYRFIRQSGCAMLHENSPVEEDLDAWIDQYLDGKRV